MPRRTVDYPDAFHGWNEVSSYGSYIAGFGMLVFFFGMVRAFMFKQRAADNPWGAGATTLEWTLSSPPPVNRKMKPSAHSIGVRNSIEPPHIVAIHEKIFTPVGTAITIVAAMK